MFGDDRHAAPDLHRRHNPTRRIFGEDLSWMDTAPHVRVHPDSRDSARTTGDSPAWAGVQAYN
jgi:hypothetical protein